MHHQIAVLAQIRPGKRAELEKVLRAGPPFDLAEHGFIRHQALLGDRTVVFLFEGDRAIGNVRSLAASLPVSTMARMGRLIQGPQLLTDAFEWTRRKITLGYEPVVRATSRGLKNIVPKRWGPNVQTLERRAGGDRRLTTLGGRLGAE